MPITKAEAIILHSRKQGETSKITTLYTREFGKMSAMAKGSRGTRSKYLGALETYNHVSLVFYNKEGRHMQYLSDASIMEPFPSLHAQLGKMVLAAVACEIVQKSEEDNQTHPQQFQLLLDTLRALDQNDQGLRHIIRAFQIQYMSMVGFEPALEKCSHCEKTAVNEVNYFSVNDGLYNCNQCAPWSESATKVSGYVIEMLRWYKRVKIDSAAQAKVSKQTGEELDALLLNYMSTHIDTLSNLSSVNHLKQLQQALNQN